MQIDRATLKTIKHDRDILAAVLSIIPGLGHIYKGHYGAGILTLLFGVPVVLWIGLLLSLATAGASMLLPLGCWVAVIANAYYAKYHRRYRLFGVL